LLVAGSTVAATLLAHGFWAASAGQQAAQTIHFMKNVAIIGGLLAVAAAGGSVWTALSVSSSGSVSGRSLTGADQPGSAGPAQSRA
jgi:uncharacterized membrane protein YphA (DoxX/SURF4 family)